MQRSSLSLFFAVFAFATVSWIASVCPARAQAAKAYAILDDTTGTVLESSGMGKKLQIGSLTKIATAMVVLDWSSAARSDLGQAATVPESIAQIASTQGVGFQPGDRCSMRDLLYAALMQSDNSAAQTLAETVGRSLESRAELSNPVDRFVAQMNALARRLGMKNTRFLNPHGLDSLERTLPYSTVEDLGKLAAYAMANSAFRFYVSQKERKITVETATGPSGYLLRNTNELLGTNAIDGVKTGTTSRAGECVIISAARPPESVQRGNEHVITPRRVDVVLLGTRDRFSTAAALLDRGWILYDAWAAAGRPERGWKAPR